MSCGNARLRSEIVGGRVDEGYDTYVCVCDVMCQYPVVDRISVQVVSNVKSVMMVLCDR